MMEKSFLPFECGRHIMDNLCSCEGAFQKESVIHKNSITLYLQGDSEDQHIGHITRDMQKERIAMAVQKKESYIGEEESEIKSLPYLIRMAAGTKVLKEQLKTLKHF